MTRKEQIKKNMPNNLEQMRIMENREIKALASKLYRQIYPSASMKHMSGHSESFDRFIALAKMIRNGEIK